jgi:hypothetical protein
VTTDRRPARRAPLVPRPGLLLAACVLLPACSEPPPPPARDPAEVALEETLARAHALAETIEDTLQPVPLMRPGEEEELRRYLAGPHLQRARSLGVRAETDERIEELIAEGRLVPLEDSAEHWIVRRVRGRGNHVVPHTRALLVELGERFQARLAGMGLPPYRLEITSALRTIEGQARLREANENAAGGVSAHEFGTTVDIAYTAFAPPAQTPATLVVPSPPGLRPYLDQVAGLVLESVSARKSRELQKILGDVLREAQAEGIVLVIMERFQPVFHVTVARALADSVPVQP